MFRYFAKLSLLAFVAGPLFAEGPPMVSGSIAAESRFFSQDAKFPGQHGTNGSLVLQPEFYIEWDDGAQGLLFVPFGRLDQGDSRRTHVDIRELAWTKAADTWELRLGIRKVFWGVAESNHLVDIINQTDLVENIDAEDKLGQPMANLALIRPWGTVDVFMLPGFRERTFPGRSGRLRTGPRVDTSKVDYESGAQNKHIDWAVRYSHVFGDIDVGLYHFWGTSREPRLLPRLTASRELVLAPRYDIINQTGTDIQATTGNWSWKFEALRRSGQGRTFGAAVGGFEYTLVGVFETPFDLGLLGEYHVDSRGESAPTPFNDDIFGGARLAINDAASSEVLAGFIIDRDGRSRSLNIEASRRFGDHWKLDLELRIFSHVARDDPLAHIEKDDYLQLELARFF